MCCFFLFFWGNIFLRFEIYCFDYWVLVVVWGIGQLGKFTPLIPLFICCLLSKHMVPFLVLQSQSVFVIQG